ncbi:uncharacterized protein BDV17DRAFT_287120 [Aspergillus undulatus]|uniref:uncharacterized protein n=1 Tax=Aspergillus undulatus TaxID=1810928 RepID=UPI003CCDCBAF
MANASDLEAGGTQQALETVEYDKYSWVLLEDHPLRSHPTDANCHPDVTLFAPRCLAVVRRCWRERGLPLLCLVMMIFLIVQLLVQLPYIVSYFLQSAHTNLNELPGFIQTSETTDRAFDHAATCVYDPLSQKQGATHDALEYALTSGCIGVKADIWLRDRDLLIGTSPSGLDDERTLQNVYLESLHAQLYARNSGVSESPEGHHDNINNTPLIGLFDEDPLQTFTLFLDVQTPMRKAWPLLVAQLRTLNENGYLSYRNLEQDLVLRPITVVVSGKGCQRQSLVDDLARAMKGLF